MVVLSDWFSVKNVLGGTVVIHSDRMIFKVSHSVMQVKSVHAEL